MRRSVFLTTRLNCPRPGDLLRQFTFARIALGNSRKGRMCCAGESFGRRERHCTHGMRIGISLEYRDTASTSNQPADHERNESAAEAGSTNIPELWMR